MNPDMPWQQPRPNNHHGRGWQASHAPQSAPRHFNFFTYVPLHRTRTILSLSLSYTHLLTVVVTSYLCFLLCSQGRLPGHACTSPCPCGHSRECRCCQRPKGDIRSPGQSYRVLGTELKPSRKAASALSPRATFAAQRRLIFPCARVL